MGKTRIAIKIDIGLTDSYSHKSYHYDYGSLLDFPSAKVIAYSPEYVMAEKFHAIITMELANSRMKDYFDLFLVRRITELSTGEMRDAIIDTFGNRKTVIPKNRPLGLTKYYSLDDQKIVMWNKYTRDTVLNGKDLQYVADDIWEWLEPICRSATELN